MSFWINLSSKYGKQLLDAAAKKGLAALKTATKKVVYKAPEPTGEFIGNKITDKIGKPKPEPVKNSKNVKEIIIPPEQRQEINGL